MTNPPLAPFAHLRRMDEQELYIAAQHMRELQGHPGWEFLQRLLASQQQAALNYMIADVRDQAKYAEQAGYIKGLKHAYDAAQAVVLIAEDEQDRHQKAVDAAERNE